MKTSLRADRPAWAMLRLQAAWFIEALARGEHRLDRAEFDPRQAARERLVASKLPDRSPERRN